MAFDAATLIATSARVTAHAGTYYGYEVCNPEEEFFALSAMSFSNSGPQAATLMAFQQLSLVTQQLARRKAWAELNEQLIVRVIIEMFQRLGLVITKRKLGRPSRNQGSWTRMALLSGGGVRPALRHRRRGASARGRLRS